MAKVHGDFGDMTRYDVIVAPHHVELGCQDCASVIAQWNEDTVNLADINRAAAEHETAEEEEVFGPVQWEDPPPPRSFQQTCEICGRVGVQGFTFDGMVRCSNWGACARRWNERERQEDG